MDINTLKKLEFDKILEQLASFTGSPVSRELALQTVPVNDLDKIKLWQEETSEGRKLLRLEPTAELPGWKDIRVHLGKTRRGAVLEPEELAAVADTLTAGRLIKNFFGSRQDSYHLLAGLASNLVALPELEKRIKDSIMPGGELADSASPELSQVRRRILNAQASVKDHLDKMTRSPVHQKYLQEPIVTIREGRYVVPVKIEYRTRVPGIIHDQSASGATLFIEPMAVVEKNNDLRRLFAAERREIDRILAGLTAWVEQHVDDIEATMADLAQLDLIMARARYSRELDAWAPELAPGEFLDIKRGRHPLLKGAVVPIDIRLGLDFDTMVITGPNTGGKTVALKTAGLMVLMAQSGLHIPAGEGSGLGIFKQVFADIGDEQSIERSLSTFSAHMTNIVSIIKQAGHGSLVLLDELGVGTDPTEGAALAQSILEKLHESGARTIATTHFGELKNYACLRERVENASVEFNTVTMLPTYRLLTGRPGRSNAFDIAVRLGLPREMTERAREFLTAEQLQADELMRELENTRQETEAELARAIQLKEEALAAMERHEKMECDLAQKKESLLARAAEEARQLVKDAGQNAEIIIKELRERIALEASGAREEAIKEAREKLKTIKQKVECALPEKVLAGETPANLLPGEEVFLPKLGQRGLVLNPPNQAGEVLVQLGIIKLSLPLGDLRRVEKAIDNKGHSRQAGVMLEKARDITAELDLRGQYVDEALQLVEKYLDDACLAGLSRVSLIHGKGTGSLRMAIHKQLKVHRRVKSFRLGEHGEGGFGVTIVDLV